MTREELKRQLALIESTLAFISADIWRIQNHYDVYNNDNLIKIEKEMNAVMGNLALQAKNAQLLIKNIGKLRQLTEKENNKHD